MTKPTEMQVINDELAEFGVEVRQPIRLCRECRFSKGPLDYLRCEVAGAQYCVAVNPRGECDRWEARDGARPVPVRQDGTAFPSVVSMISLVVSLLAFLAALACNARDEQPTDHCETHTITVVHCSTTGKSTVCWPQVIPVTECRAVMQHWARQP